MAKKAQEPVKPSKMIDTKQKRTIWAIAKKSLAIDDETLYAAIYGMFGVENMSDLTHFQAELLIREMNRNAVGLAKDALTVPQYNKIMAMSKEFGWSPKGLRQFLESEVGISVAKWLSPAQARIVISGMERIRKWKKENPPEKAADNT